MKALLVTLALVTMSTPGLCQGTVEFDNLYALYEGVNAPFYHSDRVTPLLGPQYQAELLAGPSPTNLAFIAVTGFDGGGYFFGGGRAIPGVLEGGTAWVRVDVWNTASGATFDQAHGSGLGDSWWQSSIFTVQTGCPNCPPPSDPGALTGLGFSPLYLNSVPEPPVFALFGVGVVATAFRWSSGSAGRTIGIRP